MSLSYLRRAFCCVSPVLPTLGRTFPSFMVGCISVSPGTWVNEAWPRGCLAFSFVVTRHGKTKPPFLDLSRPRLLAFPPNRPSSLLLFRTSPQSIQAYFLFTTDLILSTSGMALDSQESPVFADDSRPPGLKRKRTHERSRVTRACDRCKK